MSVNKNYARMAGVRNNRQRLYDGIGSRNGLLRPVSVTEDLGDLSAHGSSEDMGDLTSHTSQEDLESLGQARTTI
jgi:hypothetical protein